jgi:probable rRNA maturation factor
MSATMEPLVDTVIEDARWETIGLSALADAAVRATLAEGRIDPAGLTLCLMACDDVRIAALNAEFRGKPAPTNVLSWPSEDRAATSPGAVPDAPEPGPPDDPDSLGDMALSYDTCAAEAAAQDKPLSDHVTHLVVHGTLHLLGYDHEDEADADLMEATEVRILATLGVADPY